MQSRVELPQLAPAALIPFSLATTPAAVAMYCGNSPSGDFSFTVTWSGPVAVIEATFWKTPAQAAPILGFICRSRL